MIWFVLIPTMIYVVVSNWWSEWGFRLYVIFSLVAYVVLGLLSGTRRRSASGKYWRYGRLFLVWFLWGLYQVAEGATGSAISGLTLCDSDATEDEKQLVALWAPFLLLHLGDPDNLTAYALEDNKLSGRQWVDIPLNLLGVLYAILKYTIGDGHSGLLLAASLIMYVLGAVRYVARVYALWKANLDKMQEDASSESKKTPRKISGSSSGCYSCSSTDDEAKMDKLKYRIERKLDRELCDGDALLLAQDLFPIWRHAMVDSSVMPRSSRQLASEMILSLKWRSMCKVAEMELSLMYEVLYTKAIVAHTMPGWYYLIRFLSPLFVATAALLFWLHLEQQQQKQQGDGGHRIRGSFVWITYALLVIDFLLDLAWLLRALGSTWAYAYLQAQAWLHHHVICPGRWRCLHRFVVAIDPLRVLCRNPVSYRKWSGTIGQYNLLRECITSSSQCPECLLSLAGDGLKEIPYLRKLDQCVKKLLFQRVKKILLEAINKDDCKEDHSKECYIMEDMRTKWGQRALDLRDDKKLFRKLDIHHSAEAPRFGKEFEEDVLVWHIATCIVLPYLREERQRQQQRVPASNTSKHRVRASEGHAKAIAVMSEYMMFLVAVRRDMLPGLVLHSLSEVTHEALVKIWDGGKRIDEVWADGSEKKKKVLAAKNEEKLAMILRRIRTTRDVVKEEWKTEIEPTEGTELLLDAVMLFRSLMLAGDTPDDREKRREARSSGQKADTRTRVPVPEVLEFIFNVWVDKLVYAAVRCSREAHAKQLSAGGDLTTVLWMVIQHAGPFRFRMDKLNRIYIKRDAPPPTESARKKEEEEKKKKEEGQAPPAPAPYPPVWPEYDPSWPPMCPPCYPSLPPPPVCPWYPQPQWVPPQLHEEPGDEHDTTVAPTTAPTSPPDDESTEDEDQDHEIISDDEDIEEYNTPIVYITLH